MYIVDMYCTSCKQFPISDFGVGQPDPERQVAIATPWLRIDKKETDKDIYLSEVRRISMFTNSIQPTTSLAQSREKSNAYGPNAWQAEGKAQAKDSILPQQTLHVSPGL
jgi:hypothetical protein